MLPAIVPVAAAFAACLSSARRFSLPCSALAKKRSNSVLGAPLEISRHDDRARQIGREHPLGVLLGRPHLLLDLL
eukprot:5665041-Pyramimonas_sp.AAC.1